MRYDLKTKKKRVRYDFFPILMHSLYLVSGTGESDYRALYRICLIGWILIGLAYMSTLISMAQEATESVVQKAEVSAEKQDGKEKDEVPGDTVIRYIALPSKRG